MNIENRLDSIKLPKNLEQLIYDSVEQGYRKKKAMKRKQFTRRAAVAAGLLVAAGAVSIPARAFFLSVVQERMEQVPQEQIEHITDVLDSQKTDADTFSREYTKSELEKFSTLGRAYNQGTFPQQELRQEASFNAEITDNLYYAQDTSTFYLPQRELTDEEILEIIDFNSKRDYALAKTQDEPAGSSQETAGAKTAAGSITEAEAVELSSGWLSKLYGVSASGMEINHYSDSSDDSDHPIYHVNFSIRSNEYYYFSLNLTDGSLCSTLASRAADQDAAPVSTKQVEKELDTLCQDALSILKDRFAMEDQYEKIFYLYQEKDGYLSRNLVNFFFVKADGSACEIALNADSGQLRQYTLHESYEAYQSAVSQNPKYNTVNGELSLKQ